MGACLDSASKNFEQIIGKPPGIAEGRLPNSISHQVTGFGEFRQAARPLNCQIHVTGRIFRDELRIAGVGEMTGGMPASEGLAGKRNDRHPHP